MTRDAVGLAGVMVGTLIGYAFGVYGLVVGWGWWSLVPFIVGLVGTPVTLYWWSTPEPRA